LRDGDFEAAARDPQFVPLAAEEVKYLHEPHDELDVQETRNTKKLGAGSASRGPSRSGKSARP
jgi:hypothetical protein